MLNCTQLLVEALEVVVVWVALVGMAALVVGVEGGILVVGAAEAEAEGEAMFVKGKISLLREENTAVDNHVTSPEAVYGFLLERGISALT